MEYDVIMSNKTDLTAYESVADLVHYYSTTLRPQTICPVAIFDMASSGFLYR